MYKIIRSSTVPQSLNTFYKGMLSELSKNYEVIALSSSGPEMEEIRQREGVRTIIVNMERHISPLKDIVSLWRLIRVFKKERPDMVHSITPKAGLLCMMAAWITHVPIRIHTFTGLVFPTSTGIQRRILMLTDKITCFCATHVNPEGEGVKNDLLNYKITKKPLKILGHGNIRGVDMNYYSRRPEVLKIADELRDNNSFTYVFVGRIVRDKGINELCEAFDRLCTVFPNIKMNLVGIYEDKIDPISASARDIIKNNSHINAVGRKSADELLAYYASADCFVFPSYREGFPNTVLEAGAMGLPSIVTDINGAREIIVEGENGVIIPSHNSEALFQAMKDMITDNKKRENMASNARRMIEERFEQNYVRQCLYEYYEQLFEKA